MTLSWIGVPHRVLEDDIYDKYRIPKNSLVVVNVWYNIFLFDPCCLKYSSSVQEDPPRSWNIWTKSFCFRPEPLLGRWRQEPCSRSKRVLLWFRQEVRCWLMHKVHLYLTCGVCQNLSRCANMLFMIDSTSIDYSPQVSSSPMTPYSSHALWHLQPSTLPKPWKMVYQWSLK